MRIIDIGICVNNIDPKGLGRVRYKPYGTIKSEIDRYISFEEWDENDPLIAIPFLPPHINVVPQNRQSIKIIKYDTEKITQNVEYITGPFSTPHDYGSETFTTQHKNTTYGGVIVKSLPDVKDSTGEYIDKKSKSTLTRIGDVGLNGNYGSDVLFTENGLVLRGGKLLPKEIKNKKNRQKLQELPLLSDKVSKLTLKKFPNKMYSVEEDEITQELVISKVKYIIEYELNDLESPTELSVFIYRILNTNGSKFNTNVFNNSSDVDLTDTTIFKLINTDETITTPTFVVEVDSIESSCSELRNLLYTINYKSLYELNTLYNKVDIHPCYFRPTKEFKLVKPITEIETTNKLKILSSYKISSIKESSGLIFSKGNTNAPYKEIPNKVKKLKLDTKTEEQSFSSLSSDLMYLLSTSVNKGSKKLINFNELDQYEFTQEDYLNKIDPNTYGIVRGEELIKLVLLLYEFLIGHVHNINKPGIYKEELERELSNAINMMKTNLINQSLRIN